MSLERKADLHLEIALVLFMDVVGFSKLLINDQTEILEQLSQLVRETAHFREADASGKLIRLSTGDGMALVFSNSAEAPVECALEISKALRRYPQIQLHMGVHSGPVKAVSDVNDRSNVTGAGINMAQRVMALGDKAAALALSERAIASNPIEKDAVDGPVPIEILARIAAQIGEPDRAIAPIQKPLSIPYQGALASNAPLTPALFRLDPMFDPLRNDPRFQKRVASEAPQAADK